MSSFYLTTPIYYVNDLPHIGHIYTTIVADTIARYRRLKGDRVYFLTGTDEHGQKIERAAGEQGIKPLELADRVVARYHRLWKEIDMTHDDFIRTTETRHARGVEAIIRRMTEADDFYLSRHEGWYCTACEVFYTEKELLAEKRCPVHETPAEWRSEENLFFRLSKYQQQLLDWYDGEPGRVRPESRLNEVRNFVASGLRDLSVSRTQLDWGIPFPEHEGHTVYVWLDALTNYISALGFGREGEERRLYEAFWESDGTRLHLVGKDILRFHAVYWPAFLMSAGLPLPSAVWAHGWWLRDERKVSKSVGNVVRPDELIETFGSDALRYFLLREMVFGQDASFSDEAFIDRYNSDLANDLGNTTSRLVTLSRRAFDGGTPPASKSGGDLAGAASVARESYLNAMGEYAFHRALEALWKLLSETNQYLVSHEPWKHLKDPASKEHVGEVLWNGCEAVRIVATGLLPFLPHKAAEVLRALGSEPSDSLDALVWGGLRGSAELPEIAPIFPRIDKKAYMKSAEPEAATPGDSKKVGTKKGTKEPDSTDGLITIDRFFESELRVATVIEARPVPKSDRLLEVRLDLGEEAPRTVVAGIAAAYGPDELAGKQVVVVANLKPAKLMGVLSQGMMLAATVEGKPVLLHPGKDVPNGTRVK